MFSMYICAHCKIYFSLWLMEKVLSHCSTTVEENGNWREMETVAQLLSLGLSIIYRETHKQTTGMQCGRRLRNLQSSSKSVHVMGSHHPDFPLEVYGGPPGTHTQEALSPQNCFSSRAVFVGNTITTNCSHKMEMT